MKGLIHTLRAEIDRARTRWLCLAAILLTALGVALLPQASSQDRNFAGSVQGSYLYVHDSKFEARDRALDPSKVASAVVTTNRVNRPFVVVEQGVPAP